MHDVFLLVGGKGVLTQVWASAYAMEQIKAHCEDPRAMMEKLKGFARAGFWNLEGEQNAAIRHEVGHAYRVRYKKSSLLRLVGFYETAHKRDFMAFDAFQKPGDDYTDAQWRQMQEISKVKERNEWRRAPIP